tara:strand:- start:2010 stop:2198 length:189 start_codon:yes stop_codon:yes gene_type:complete
MYDIDKEIRLMIINIIKEYNKTLLSVISAEFNLDQDKMLEKYLTPYYYMPVIERDLKTLTID